MCDTTDIYDVFMREIVELVEGTSLAPQPLRGYSIEELQVVEGEIGKKLPRALWTWYRYIGHPPLHTRDHYDYSIRDLMSAQEVLWDVINSEGCNWKPTETTLPFSQRLGAEIMFVDTSEGDDPPVYHYLESTSEPRLVNVTFSSHVRELILGLLKYHAQWELYVREIHSEREKGEAYASAKSELLMKLDDEARTFRQNLITQVVLEDKVRGTITGPKAFQTLWVRQFSQTDTWQQMQAAKMPMPMGWINSHS